MLRGKRQLKNITYYAKNMITARQMKVARTLLDWSQPELAKASGLSLPTIQRMEKLGPGRSTGVNVEAVEIALQNVGIEIDDDGVNVRLKKAEP